MRRTTLPVLLVALLLLAAPTAYASVVLETSVTDMTRLSSLVVRGEVVQTKSRETKSGSVETVVTLHVSEVLKGAAEAETIEVILPGGAVGEIGVRVPGTPRFTVGEETVVFLEARPQGLVVCGQEQGRFVIRRDTGDRKPMAVRQFSRGLSLVRPGGATLQPKDDDRTLAELRSVVREAVTRYGAKPEPLKVVFPRLSVPR